MPIPGDAGFLLDTNVISEATRAKPNQMVLAWLGTVDEERLFLSVATIAEIKFGIDGMAVGAKQRRLRDWLDDDLISRFDKRILAVGVELALLLGSTVRRSKQAGHQIGTMDALIAATAAHHNLTLVTRNSDDFQALSLTMFNPWSAVGP
jgi:toxin FitB